MQNLVTIDFHGDQITAVETQTNIYVSILPLCERVGIARRPQQIKINADPDMWGGIIMVLPSLGGEQQTLCIPVSKLAAWLISIHPAKVKPEFRDALIRYRNEAADVLDRHFRLRTQEADARLEELQGENLRLRALTLAHNGMWSKIVRFQEAGWPRASLRYIFRSMPFAAFDELLDWLEESGVIDPDAWGESAEAMLARHRAQPQPDLFAEA